MQRAEGILAGVRVSEIRHIADLKQDPDNARSHTARGVGMIEEALNEAPNQVTVGAASIFPLTVYFNQNYVISFDQAFWTAEFSFLIRSIEL